MKPLPIILDQGNVGSCQTYATVQQLLRYGIVRDPQDLYKTILDWNYGREPNTHAVMAYLKFWQTIRDFDVQRVGRQGAWRWIGSAYSWLYPQGWQLRVAKNVCNNKGGLLSIRVDPDKVKADGVLTEKMLKEGSDHLVYLYDFDDEQQRFILVNSWGTGYADGTGCLYLPYGLIKNVNELLTLSI